MGAELRERAGAEGERRAADGCHEGCGPGWWRHGAAAWGTRRPSGLPRGRQQGRGRLWQRDGSRLNTTRAGVAPALQPAQAGRVGSDRCSRRARTALGAVRYANTRRLPPHQGQVKTSNANVLRSSFAKVHSRRPLLLRFLPDRCLRCHARPLLSCLGEHAGVELRGRPGRHQGHPAQPRAAVGGPSVQGGRGTHRGDGVVGRDRAPSHGGHQRAVWGASRRG
jgi:hypothetical protein